MNYLDILKGGLLGITTDALGSPVDFTTMAMRPFGYKVQNPVMGSDWLMNKISSPVHTTEGEAARFIGGLLSPDPMDVVKFAGLLGATKYQIQKTGSKGYVKDAITTKPKQFESIEDAETFANGLKQNYRADWKSQGRVLPSYKVIPIETDDAMKNIQQTKSKGEEMAYAAMKQSDDLTPRLKEYEKWIQYYLDKGDPVTSAHNSALMISGLTGDGLLRARTQAGKAATSKPGIF